jgi:hypothetical protein
MRYLLLPTEEISVQVSNAQPSHGLQLALQRIIDAELVQALQRGAPQTCDIIQSKHWERLDATISGLIHSRGIPNTVMAVLQ